MIYKVGGKRTFRPGDLVCFNSTGKLGIVTKMMWAEWGYMYKITGVDLWTDEDKLTLISSAWGNNQ